MCRRWRRLGLRAFAPSRGWSATKLVEDWQAAALGTTGVPPDWQPYETLGGHPAYDFTVVEDAGHRALLMKSDNDHSTIAKKVELDLRATEIFRWDWKILRFPEGADLRRRATSDATGHLFVVWPRFPALIRSRLIGYVWDATLPADTVVRSRKSGTVTFIVVRSGPERLGQWVTEERNVANDYRRVFGETAPNASALALSPEA